MVGLFEAKRKKFGNRPKRFEISFSSGVFIGTAWNGSSFGTTDREVCQPYSGELGKLAHPLQLPLYRNTFKRVAPTAVLNTLTCSRTSSIGFTIRSVDQDDETWPPDSH